MAVLQLFSKVCFEEFNKDENIKNVEKFLEKHKDFEMCDITEYLNGKTFTDCGKGYVQVLPGEYGMDGFFIAKFKKL